MTIKQTNKKHFWAE